MPPSRIAPAALTAVLILSLSHAAQARRYRVTDLGTLPAAAGGTTLSYGGSINARGDVAGVSGEYIPGGLRLRAVLWRDGAAIPLDGDAATGDSLSAAINDSGQVAGAAFPNGLAHPSLPFLFTPGAASGFSILPGTDPGLGAIATGLNNAGAIVGTAQIAGHDGNLGLIPVRYDGQAALPLPALPQPEAYDPSAGATAINDSGRIAGFSQAFDGRGALLGYRAYGGDGTTAAALPTPPGTGYSFVTSINAAGQITGYAQSLDAGGTDTGQRAILWDGADAISLGTLGSGAPDGSTAFQSGYAIASGSNMSGQVVGKSLAFDPAGGAIGEHGVIWENGAIADLNTMLPEGSPWTVTAAVSINDAGQIAATAAGPDGTRAVLLTPLLDANEAALYPRMIATGRSSKLTLQFARPAAVARTITLASSNPAIRLPAKLVMPAGKTRISFTVQAAPGKRGQSATVSLSMDKWRMRTALRSVPMR